MRKSTEISNLPVFSILDGKEVGSVSSLLINADKRTIDYLIIKTNSLEFGIKAIPFGKIEGIGDFAVTIEDAASIVELSATPSAHDMLEKNIQIINNKVMTKKGSLLGKVSEYYIDEKTGTILGTVLKAASDDKIILQKDVVTFGKEVVVVIEDIANQLISFDEFAKSAETLAVTYEPAPEPLITVADTVAAAVNIYEATVASEEQEVTKQFEDRQAMFLKGKKVMRDFLGESGEVLIPAGSSLTEEQILQVKALGRNKLLELSMSVTD